MAAAPETQQQSAPSVRPGDFPPTINLTTARGSERTKELGVRNALGATRSQLMLQFLGEAVVTALISLVMAVLIVELLLPSFNDLLDKRLTFNYLSDPAIATNLLLLTLATGALAGAYPAFILSKFKAVDVFRGNAHFGTGAAGFRTAMVVVQFGLAVTLTIATIFIYMQMNHVRRLDLGFNGSNVVVLENMGWTEIRPQYESLRFELLRNPDIEEVSRSLSVPGREFDRVGDFYISGRNVADAVSLHRMSVDHDFFRTYGFAIVAGRDFSRDHGMDVIRRVEPGAAQPIFSAIINETAVRQLGWTDSQQVIGHVMFSADQSWSFGARIVGVVQDFHILAGHGAISPYVYVISPQVDQLCIGEIDRGERACDVGVHR